VTRLSRNQTSLIRSPSDDARVVVIVVVVVVVVARAKNRD